MPKFIYTLKDEKGRDYQGIIEAKNEKSAHEKLNTVGYYLVSLKRDTRLSLFSKKISKTEIIAFFRQSATMIEAGIPIIKSLMGLAAESENDAFKIIINDIRSKIESGFKLSETMRQYPKIFSEFVINMVQTGETAGNLAEMLRRIASYLEREEDLRRRVRTAFAYPVVVSVVAVCVVTYLVLFVVPVFTAVYNSMKIVLPVPTRILIAISGFVRNWWVGIFIISAAIIFGFRKIRNDEKVSFLIDKFKISLPLFGALNRKVAISRFIRCFGFMISSGIPITKALDVAEPIAENRVISKVIDRAKQAVKSGSNIAGPLRVGRIFPPVIIQMIATGEESGTLDAMLFKSADFLDEEIDVAIKTLTVKIEPILTFALAIIVGFIALAIYLPMFDLIRQISK